MTTLHRTSTSRRRSAPRAAAMLALLTTLSLTGCSPSTDAEPTAPGTTAPGSAPTTPAPTDQRSAPTPAPAPAPTAEDTATPAGEGPATPAAADPPALTETCTSPLGFTVRHPPGWAPPTGTTDQPCTWFSPETGDVDEAPITVSVETGDSEVAGVPEVGDFTVAERREGTVAGRPALRTTGVWTNHGYAMTSSRLAIWAVPLEGGEVLVLRAVDCCGIGIADAQAVLDAMAASVTLT